MPSLGAVGARLVAVVLVVLVALPAVPVAAAQPASTTSTTLDPSATGILPRPNSGAPPGDPGDRGGWAQGLVFALTLAGIGVVVAMVVRSSRRARAAAVNDPRPPSGSA